MHKQRTPLHTQGGGEGEGRKEEGVKPCFVLLRILCQEHAYLRYVFRLNVKHDLEAGVHTYTHTYTHVRVQR